MTFTLTVKNTGAALLIAVTDTDSVAPGCSTSYPTLAVNATETITCTISAPADDFVNIVAAVGNDPLDASVSGGDKAALDVIHRDELSRSN